MKVVIIGGGLAGGNVAVGLREEGFDGEILILGDEPDIPFGRPPLSKEYLREEEDVWLVQPGEWYAENNVELETGARVISLDTAAGRVLLNAREIAYDKLCIATGCRPKMAPLPGADLEGIHALRTRADCEAIRAAAKSDGAKGVIVGMSFIGAEVAASLRQMGVEVAAAFPGTGPLASLLGDEIARRLAKIHEEHGVQMVPGEKVVGFEGKGRVEAVNTESGRRLECTFAVLGLGVQPNIEFLHDSGVDVDDGVVVNSSCESNVPGVFAAGDVARHDHPLFGPIRTEHYNNAEKQGRHVARAMLGKAGAYDYMHSLWSDQYDHNLEYVGYAGKWDEFVYRESEGDGVLGFYMSGGKIKAAVGLDSGGDPEADPESELAACAGLIRNKTVIDPALLADNEAPLPRAPNGSGSASS